MLFWTASYMLSNLTKKRKRNTLIFQIGVCVDSAIIKIKKLCICVDSNITSIKRLCRGFTPVPTDKNMVKFRKRSLLYPINNRRKTENSKNENSDFSIDLHYHTLTSGRNINSTSVSRLFYSHSSFPQNVTSNPTSENYWKLTAYPRKGMFFCFN